MNIYKIQGAFRTVHEAGEINRNRRMGGDCTSDRQHFVILDDADASSAENNVIAQ